MNKYQKIITVSCLGFIILLYIIFGVKHSVLSRQVASGSSFEPGGIKETLSGIQRKQISLETRLDKIEIMIAANPKAANPGSSQASQASTPAGIFINENIFKDNLDTKAIWNPTNKPNVFIVAIKLQEEPDPNSLLVWTGMGMLPFDAFTSQGDTLSILFQQSKEAFVAGNNYINIRYVPRAK